MGGLKMDDKMLVQLTVGQLTEIVKGAVAEALATASTRNDECVTMSTAELCERLGVSSKTLQRMMLDGDLDGIAKRITYRSYLVNMACLR